ncbi:MAG: hypothetical protein Hals2KO_16550 [Halioglobus sp.]
MVRPELDQLREDHGRNFGWALACCGWQRDLAEDVLQEAYLRVLDGRAQFKGRSALSTWFYAVIKHVASELRRTQQRRSILNLRTVDSDGHDLESPEADGDGTDPIQAQETAELLRAALMQLSVRQREVLHLVFYSEMTVEEAALVLEVSVGSARTHYHRGKERLVQLLNLDREDV